MIKKANRLGINLKKAPPLNDQKENVLGIYLKDLNIIMNDNF